MRSAYVLALLCLFAGGVKAETSGHLQAGFGGWGYDIDGSYTNTERLDLDDDLGLKESSKADFVLGYAPVKPGWVPALELGYNRITARGQQRFQLLPANGLEPVTGALVPDTVVDDRTEVRDFELNVRWPVSLGPVILQGGFTVTRLDGSVRVADESNGQVMEQQVDEIFPLLSAGIVWQALPSLRLSFSGDYIRYEGNRASELEGKLLWKFFGPVGLQAGYRERRYKIDEPMNSLDARVHGGIVGVVMELPI